MAIKVGARMEGLAELRAALGAVEKRARRILLARDFLWRQNAWRLKDGGQAFPVSEVTAVYSLAMEFTETTSI